MVARNLVGVWQSSQDGSRVSVSACRMGLEGIISKHRDRPYRRGKQQHWVKVKDRLRNGTGALETSHRPALIRRPRSVPRRSARSARLMDLATLANGEDLRPPLARICQLAPGKGPLGDIRALLRGEGPPARRPILLKIVNCIILRLRNAAVVSASPGWPHISLRSFHPAFLTIALTAAVPLLRPTR